MRTANLYLTASSRQQGALAIFHAYGEEAALSRVFDARIGGKSAASAPTGGSAPAPGGLRYGWIRDSGGEVIDEVMLAVPAKGRRVLMTHGGRVVREQVEAYLEQSGFSAIPFNSKEIDAIGDPLLDSLLASCVTEGQTAAVLAARERGDASAESLAPVLAQRRVVLAGAPNAGKSSLLNALAGYDRAFVDPEAGATRDVVDELVDLAGHAVWVGDMPGYGGAEEGLDAEAWSRAVQRLRLAEEIWFVIDSSEEWTPQTEGAASAVAAFPVPVLVILNKMDQPARLVGEPWKKHFPAAPAVSLGALPGGNAVEALEAYAAETWKV